MSKNWYSIKAQSAESPAEVAIRGLIGDWGVTDATFIADVQALGDVSELVVRINSRGGEVDHALAIFNFLRAHAARIVVRIEGVALSSGSIIALAGDEIIMPANTVMMVHNPWTYAAGNAEQLRQVADQLDAYTSALMAVYLARTGKTEVELREMLDAETHMTAAEAVELGFADVLEPIAQRSASSSATAVAFATALGIPQAVLDKIAAIEAQAGAEPLVVQSAETPGITTQVEQLVVAAGLEEHLQVFLLDPGLQQIEAAQAAIAQARDVTQLCTAVKQPALAAGFIRSRTTLADVRAGLARALADESDSRVTNGQQPASADAPKTVSAKRINFEEVRAKAFNRKAPTNARL